MKTKPKTKKPKFGVRYAVLWFSRAGPTIHAIFDTLAEAKLDLAYMKKVDLETFGIVRLEVLSGD